MADNTVYDSAFRTMIEKIPELVIPLINEAFDRDYPVDEPFERWANEHETPEGRRITDSFFKVRDMWYHVECESGDDSSMVVRMIEYDFAIALEQAIRDGAPYHMRMPDSCVLYLRDPGFEGDTLGMRVDLPRGGSFDYEVRVMRAQAYGGDEIFAKRLLVLLPFYIMRYEGRLDAIEGDESATADLLAEVASLRKGLERAACEGRRSELYERIVELSVRVSDHVLAKRQILAEEVRRSMGGEVLELMVDRIAAAEKEARKQGLEQGREEGREEGREQGREEQRAAFVGTLREFGLDDAVIEQIVSAASR